MITNIIARLLGQPSVPEFIGVGCETLFVATSLTDKQNSNFCQIVEFTHKAAIGTGG